MEKFKVVRDPNAEDFFNEEQELSKYKEKLRDFQPAIDMFIPELEEIAPVVPGFNMIAAPSGFGKTTLMINQIMYSCEQLIKQGRTDEYILVLSTEALKDEFYTLAACILVGINPKTLNSKYKNTVTREQLIQLIKAEDYVKQNYNIDFVHSGDVFKRKNGTTVPASKYFDYAKVRSSLDEYFGKKGKLPHLVCVDYLQGIPLYYREMDETQHYNAYGEELRMHTLHNVFGKKYPLIVYAQLDGRRLHAMGGDCVGGENLIRYTQSVYQNCYSVSYYYKHDGVYKYKCIKARFTGEIGKYVQVGFQHGRLVKEEPISILEETLDDKL